MSQTIAGVGPWADVAGRLLLGAASTWLRVTGAGAVFVAGATGFRLRQPFARNHIFCETPSHSSQSQCAAIPMKSTCEVERWQVGDCPQARGRRMLADEGSTKA